MNMATASGNLFLDHFVMEVFPRFSLPHLHSLMETFIPEMILEKVKKNSKEYIGRDDCIFQQTRKFQYAELSSRIGNFRSKEHEMFNGVL